MTHKLLQIAIDGPAGAGKSTVAKAVAAHFGIIYLDTGAMYRAVGLGALNAGVATDNEEAVCALLDTMQLDVLMENGEQKVVLEGQDVSAAIRTPEAARTASDVSRYAGVRTWLVDKQRQIAGAVSVVMDGRDIGTVVLPRATHKFFLTAAVETRAQRRALELQAKGETVDMAALIRAIAERDHQDMTRAVSPLRKAQDALEVDTTAMTQQQVVQYIIACVEGEAV